MGIVCHINLISLCGVDDAVSGIPAEHNRRLTDKEGPGKVIGFDIRLDLGVKLIHMDHFKLVTRRNRGEVVENLALE